MRVQISEQVFLRGSAHVPLSLFFLSVDSLKLSVFFNVRDLQLFLVY